MRCLLFSECRKQHDRPLGNEPAQSRFAQTFAQTFSIGSFRVEIGQPREYTGTVLRAIEHAPDTGGTGGAATWQGPHVGRAFIRFAMSCCRPTLLVAALCIAAAAATPAAHAEFLRSSPVVPRPTGAAPPAKVDTSGRIRHGIASFYALRFAGRRMADGTRMDPHGDNA
ncbi:MAG TPA: hypothetical protein VIO33_04580, partial [Burkholderiaceae bacterium]